MTQVRLGRNDLAIADFDHALEADPEFLRAYRNRGDARLTRREYGPAIADYDRAIALSEPDAHLLLRRGRAHFLSGDYRRAIADADQAEQLDPASWRPPSDRADALAASNQLSRAVRDYTRAIELAPDEPWNYMQRAALHTRLGDNRRAEADYREAVQRSPQNADVQNNLCWTIARNGVALEVARMACDTAIRLRADARFFDSRGFVSYKQGRFEDALRDYESALRLDPNRAHSLYGRGLTLSRLDRSAEATADISRAMSLDATIADTYRSYGVGP